MMTPRERFKAVMSFRKPDVLPWFEQFYDETLVRWLMKGLPADKLTVIEWTVCGNGTVLLNWPAVMGFNPFSYFGCQTLTGCYLPIDVGPIPRYMLRTINETNRYADIITETGAIARRLKGARASWYSMPMYLKFPVENRESWEKYKERLNPKDPRRYPKNWSEDVYLEVFEKYEKGVTDLIFTGLYGFGAQLMGIERFASLYYKDPDLLNDIAEYWEFFTIETIRDAVETLKDRIDLVYWWEDMAEKHGPCISPRIYREVFLPHYRSITGFLRKNKVDRIMMDSDGNMNILLDLIIEGGITGLWPLEVNSGMDAITIRKKYGTKLFLAGNLDKRILARGGEEMRGEIDSKLAILKDLGGYIPSVDHLVHVEFTLERFQEYTDYLKGRLSY